MKIITRWAYAGLLLLVMLSTTAQAVTVPVNWDISEATCEISTLPSGVIPLGDVDVAPLFASSAKNWDLAGKQKFKILLGNCNGGITTTSGSRPSVTVTGDVPFIVSGYDNQFLFKSGGDSEGVYIVLVKDKKDDGEDGNNIEVKNGSRLWVPGYGTDTVLPAGQPIEIPLTAAVACGNFSFTGVMCKGAANVRAGDLRASFTLTFEYK